MTTTVNQGVRQKPKLALSEALNFAYETFRANKVRFTLTAVGVVMGTASLILVVTIGMTGRQYVLGLIQSIGVNEIWAEYKNGGQRIGGTASDFLTIDDLLAVQHQLPEIVAATPVVSLGERIPFGEAKQCDVSVLGVYPNYQLIRNLVVVSGRFFDLEDEKEHNKVAVLTRTMAQRAYGSPDAAIGQVIKLSELPFTVIGTFRESVDTFGTTEVVDNTMVIPYSVSRYLKDTNRVSLMYFSAASPALVDPTTAKIQEILQSRHRSESVYTVENLSQLVTLADKTAMALTLVLLAVAAVVLVVSGIGIMNIMLSTVTSRTREIGIRKALGATNREICLQFLSEAIIISLGGGIIGALIGLAVPVSVGTLTEYHIPISGLSVIVAIAVSCSVGILFGTVPALNAAKLRPVESLRYE